jgi:hypothetical protein
MQQQTLSNASAMTCQARYKNETGALQHAGDESTAQPHEGVLKINTCGQQQT